MKMQFRLLAGTVLASILFFTNHAKAQTAAKQLDLFLGISAGLPTGDRAQFTSFTLGGDIRLQYGLSDKLALTFTTGGYHFFPSSKVTGDGYGMGPIKIGGKYFFNKNYYFGLEAGIGVEVTDDGFDGIRKFLLAPAVGYVMDRWDFGIRYESYTGDNDNFGQIALRAAYAFRLSKK